MIIKDPPKNVKVKKNPPDVEPRARPGTTLTTRTTRARDSLNDVRRRHVRSHRVQVRRDRRWCRPRQARDPGRRPAIPRGTYFVFVARSSRSLARAHPEEIASSARAFAIGTSGKRVGSTDAARCATDDARDDSNEYIFIRSPARAGTRRRASRRRDAGVFKRVSRCPRARVRCPKNARCYPISRLVTLRMCDGCLTRDGVFEGVPAVWGCVSPSRVSPPSRVSSSPSRVASTRDVR